MYISFLGNGRNYIFKMNTTDIFRNYPLNLVIYIYITKIRFIYINLNLYIYIYIYICIPFLGTRRNNIFEMNTTDFLEIIHLI